MTNEQLLAEVEDVLRTSPTRERPYGHQDWLGRAVAVVRRWSRADAIIAMDASRRINSGINMSNAFDDLLVLLNKARSDLRMELGRSGVVVPTGQVYDYYDAVRKVIETAREELFFVDPYLSVDFVRRYLVDLAPGVSVRLLGTSGLDAVLPAVDLLAQQQRTVITVRSTTEIHDRFLFIDRRECHASGASFKDGARRAPATFTPLVDAFDALLATYEALWRGARSER